MNQLPEPLTALLGITWPGTVGAEARGNGVQADVLCVGPTEWWVIAESSRRAVLHQQLNEALEGSPFRAADASSAFAHLAVEGFHSRALLAKGCALDLHPSVFPPQRLARTRFAGMPVVVRCTHPSAFECIVSLSYHEYLTAWLDDAAIEFVGKETRASL